MHAVSKLAIFATLAVTGASSVSAFVGEGTFYLPAGGLGSCGTALFDNDAIAALAIPRRAGVPCGSCARVSGPKGSVVVKIMDSCAGCKWDDIDLARGPFLQIADESVGRLQVTWDLVDCASGQGQSPAAAAPAPAAAAVTAAVAPRPPAPVAQASSEPTTDTAEAAADVPLTISEPADTPASSVDDALKDILEQPTSVLLVENPGLVDSIIAADPDMGEADKKKAAANAVGFVRSVASVFFRPEDIQL